MKKHNLVNQNDQAYINLDDLLRAFIHSGGKGKAQANVDDEKKLLGFIRRDQLVKNTLEAMQGWYEVRAEGKDVVAK